MGGSPLGCKKRCLPVGYVVGGLPVVYNTTGFPVGFRKGGAYLRSGFKVLGLIFREVFGGWFFVGFKRGVCMVWVKRIILKYG